MKFHDKVKTILPEIIPYLIDMQNCMQDPIWHSEGDVLTHTLMVLDEVEKLDIIEEDKELLRWVALFHDIGKPSSTLEENGHIRSHGHSKKGYHLALKLLDNTNLSNLDKLQIVNIIRVHGKPNYILSDFYPERQVIKMSMDCRLDLLYYFVKCDILGRICNDDGNDFLENLEYFKIIATDLDCFDKPYNFPTDVAKFNYLVKKTHHYLDNPYNDTKSKVYLVCGLPGSGKDYYIKSNLTLPVVSLDNIRRDLKIKPTAKQGFSGSNG